MKDFEDVLEYVELPMEHRTAEVRAAALLTPAPTSTTRHQLTSTPAHPTLSTLSAWHNNLDAPASK